MANVKKELTINFSAKSIELTESFEKKASIYGSAEYTASHSATTPGGGELIRRQSAKLPHRNLTSPPSL